MRITYCSRWTLLSVVLLIYQVVASQTFGIFPRDDAATSISASSAAENTGSASGSASIPATSGQSQQSTASMTSSVNATTDASAAPSSMPSTASGVVLGASASPVANISINSTDVYVPQISGLPIQPQFTPALIVAGIILMGTGVVYTLVGIKTPRLHVFLSAAYLFALATAVLIIYVMHPPIPNGIQAAYVVAATMTGLVFGSVAIIFSDVTEGLCSLLGGYCLSMWFLVLKPGGLIASTAGKAIFIGCFIAGSFVLYVSHYTRPYSLIGSISVAGATVVVLGVDMVSRAGLKEFWLYIWNLNSAIFPYHYAGPYPITRGIRVELACMVIFAMFGIMSQMRIWKIVKERRDRKSAKQRKKDLEREQAEEELGMKVEAGNTRDRAAWDAVYSNHGPSKVSQVDSGIGTEAASTRKGSMSMVDVREFAAEGMELHNLEDPNGSTMVGRVTVHVAQDDAITVISPAVSASPQSRSVKSRQPSLSESQTSSPKLVATYLPSSKSAPVISGKLSRENLATIPQVIPLPFKLPSDEIAQSLDDKHEVSSIATFAATEPMPERPRKGLSNLKIVRRLSEKSKAGSIAASISKEALISQKPESDKASSIAATLDGISEKALEGISSGQTSPSFPPPAPEKHHGPASGSQSATDESEEARSTVDASTVDFVSPPLGETPRQSVEGSKVEATELERYSSPKKSVKSAVTSPKSVASSRIAASTGTTANQQVAPSVKPGPAAVDNAPEEPDDEEGGASIVHQETSDESHATAKASFDDEFKKEAKPSDVEPTEGALQAEGIMPSTTAKTSSSENNDQKAGEKVIRQQASRTSLAGVLPEAAPKIVTAYRTNEWAKHLANAEPPEVQELQVKVPRVPVTKEAAAPVNVDELQQTALTAEPAPVINSTPAEKHEDVPASPPTTRQGPKDNDAVADYAYFSKHALRKSKSACNTNLSKANLTGPSQSSPDLPLPEQTRPPLPRHLHSTASLSRSLHSNNSQMLTPPLAESPIHEHEETSFPARFNPSPLHLMSQRQSIVRNRPSSTSLQQQTSSLGLQHVRIPAAPSNENDDDDVPLSHRRSFLKEQDMHRRSLGNLIPESPDTNLVVHKYPSRLSLRSTFAGSTTVQQPRDSNIASSWRASLVADPTHTALKSDAELEQRRSALLAEKRRSTSYTYQQKAAAQHRASMQVTEMQRTGNLNDMHREALRRMQGEANRSLHPN